MLKLTAEKQTILCPQPWFFFLNKVALKIENGMCAHLLYILN